MTWDQRAWNKLVSRTTASSNISGAGQPKLYVPVSVLPLTSYATLMTLHHFGGGFTPHLQMRGDGGCRGIGQMFIILKLSCSIQQTHGSDPQLAT